MEVNKLVDLARKKALKLQEAEAMLEQAKHSYHRSIKAMHSKGMSYREIAGYLELSHQRVHQIVSSTAPDSRTCLFCNLEVNKDEILKSKKKTICFDCLYSFQESLGQFKNKKHKQKRPAKEQTGACRFCLCESGKKNQVIQIKKNSICQSCVDSLSAKVK